MKHLSVKKPGQRRKLKGNATGLNMIGIGKIPRNDGMACSQVPHMINHVPAERVVVLSSGDEGICEGAGTPSPNRQDSFTLSPGSTVVAVLSSPSPSTGSMEAFDDDDIMPVPNYFTRLKAKARQPRKRCMKDQLGNSPVKVVPRSSKRSAKRQKPKQDDPSSPPLKRMHKYVSEAVRLTRVDVRLTRVGTQRREVNIPVVFTTDYIQIDEEVCVATSTLTSCHWCLSRKLPSLFLRTTPAECHRLRLLLKMSRRRTQGASWYDSNGANLGDRYIILIFADELPEFDQVVLKRIFETIGRANHVDDFISKLTFEEANSIIMNSCEKAASDLDIFQNKLLHCVLSSTESATQAFEKVHYKTTLGSPVFAKEAPEVIYGPESPQKIPKATACQPPQPSAPQPLPPTHIADNDDSAVDLSSTFTEPVRRLIVYPPPPARQGISVTNEDFCRLDEGEFLNDVIIDFYLRYLVMSKLKEVDAKRSYMFSSFFYKRLTQTEQNTSGEKKQRHSRVKTWTRHVDLFQKDFIFVPINKTAHWFLAVICFPGLVGSQSEPESPHQPPPSPPPPSPQDPSPDPAPFLFHHQPVDDSSTDPPLPHDPDPSPDHLQQTDENPSWSGLFTPPPQCPEEPVSPLWDESENYMDQAFVLDFTPSPNPMSLFFTDMEEDPFSSSDADLPEERSGAMSTSDEADLLSSIMELCVKGSTSSRDQTDGQQPQADICHKDSEEARDVYLVSFDQDAEQDECSGEEQQDEQKDFAEILSKPAICKRPCILIMDSLGGQDTSDIVETLQEYLEVEWELRKGTRREFGHMEGSVPQVPQQDNYSDCGVYLLQYVESFFQDPLNSFQPPIDLKDWFPLKQVKSKRAEIRELILTLEQRQGHDEE